MIGGGVLKAYGDYQNGQDLSQGYQLSAAAKRAQAAQVEIAMNRELDVTERKFQLVRQAQFSAIGRSGVMLRGSPLAQMEEAAANHVSEMMAIRQAGSYRKTSLLTEGLVDERKSVQAENAGTLSAFGDLLGVASQNPYTYDSPRITNKPTAVSAREMGDFNIGNAGSLS